MMTRIIFLSLLSLLWLTACETGNKPATGEHIAESFSDLKENFANPHATFRPAPFWIWNGTVAEVTVNRQKAGIIGWPPYTLDVSGFIQQGKNNVSVEIIGSLRNVLGPFNTPPAGIATPQSWRYQPPYRSGNEYHLLNYGLSTPFSLCKQ